MNNELATHWRDSALFPKLFIIDARACFPLLLFMVHMRMSTLIISVISVAFLLILNKFNLSVRSFFILLREAVGGSKKR